MVLTSYNYLIPFVKFVLRWNLVVQIEHVLQLSRVFWKSARIFNFNLMTDTILTLAKSFSVFFKRKASLVLPELADQSEFWYVYSLHAPVSCLMISQLFQYVRLKLSRMNSVHQKLLCIAASSWFTWLWSVKVSLVKVNLISTVNRLPNQVAGTVLKI